ncbi:MAG: kelch repeat-containing protein, partial [bacterium]
MNLGSVGRRLLGGGHRRRATLNMSAGVIVTLVLSVSIVSLVLAATAGFSDVPPGHPYAVAVSDLAGRQVIGGFPDGTFRPDNSVIRQQFAKMIVKTLEYPVADTNVCLFSDVVKSTPGAYVDPTDPLYPDHYVAVCAFYGITQGKTATIFAPYDGITRQQLITMISRAANLSDPPTEYTPPFSPGQFYPQEHYLNARRAAYAGLLQGLEGMGPDFDFFGDATRGECAQLLRNLLLLRRPSNVWTNLNPSGPTPAARVGHSMVYDSAQGRVILFGGVDNSDAIAGDLLNDTWAYDPSTNTWTELAPAGPLPAPRYGQAMVYDSAQGKVIMFGGIDAFGSSLSTVSFLNDTWAYDPITNTWTDLAPPTTKPGMITVPIPRVTARQMVYDSAQGKVILFGGFRSSFSFLGDTWAYDPSANTWTGLGPSGALPSARALGSMAYDPVTAKTLLFGGMWGFAPFLAVGDTFAYDSGVSTWSNLDPSGTLPAARQEHAMVHVTTLLGSKLI